MNNEQIATAFVACKNWAWTDGMRVRSYALAGVGGPYETFRLEDPVPNHQRYNVFPDVEDDATRGCILGLLRRLSGWSDLHMSVTEALVVTRWWANVAASSIPPEIEDVWASSEIEAMLQTLQALDNALTENP
jgi:hypothetical protein